MIHTLLGLAAKNITRRVRYLPGLAVCIFAAIFSAVFTWSVYDLIQSGLALSRERQGADVMAYPSSAELSDASMLYSGLAQSVYMDSGVLEALDDGRVESITWQFYLQTLPSAGCCTISQEYRLVGIDWESDFAVRPWIAGELGSLEERQIILGHNLAAEIGEGTILLNLPVKVAAVLEPTGTALDNSIIMSISQLRSLAKINFPPSFFGGGVPAQRITCALIRLKEGVPAQDYIETHRQEGMKLISTSAVEDTLQRQVRGLSGLLFAMVGIILVLCWVSLSAQFCILTLGRYAEVGYLRGIGMTRMGIYGMFALEFGCISLAAGGLGSTAGLLAARAAVEWIRGSLAVPLGAWDWAFTLGHAGGGLALALAVCAMATFLPLRRIAGASPQDAMTKGAL